MTTSTGTAVDIADLLDEGLWTPFQKIVVGLAALSVILDGFDSQLIGYAIPSLMKEWGFSRGVFTPVVAAGLIGMSLGSASAGLVADRFGRRVAILISVVVFGVATCAIGFAPDLFTIGLLRFVAGLGIGGALPSSTTLSAEFTPRRHRTMMITLTIVCVPLGGMLAGLYAGYVLPSVGWRPLFIVGGVLPLCLAAAMTFVLPESPRFLARRPSRWPDLVRMLARIGRPLATGTAFADRSEAESGVRSGVATLFAGNRRRDTLALWGTFFLCLLAVYSAFSWLPTMLAAQGLNVSQAGAGLTAYNLGGTLGSLLCAGAIQRYGSRIPLVTCALAAAASAFLLETVDIGQTMVLVVGLGVHGLFVNGVQSTLYAVAAHVYPTGIRATGTAAALAFGRLGAILSAFVGAAVISAAGPGSFLTVLGSSMLGVAVLLTLLRDHIPVAERGSQSLPLPKGRPA